MENGLGLAWIYQQMWWESVCVGGGCSHSVCVCVCVWGGGGCSHSVCIGTLVIIQARTCYSSGTSFSSHNFSTVTPISKI